MQTLNFLGRVFLIYVAMIVTMVIVLCWLGPHLDTVNGQMALIFGIVAFVPGALKMARGVPL